MDSSPAPSTNIEVDDVRAAFISQDVDEPIATMRGDKKLSVYTYNWIYMLVLK